jgi:hypothetical protein
METYVLIVLVALFLGVMGVIAMMERRQRTELARSEQLHQTLAACVTWLQTIHSGDEAQMSKIADALSQLRIAVETGTKSSSTSAAALSTEATSKELLVEAKHATKAVQDLQASMEASVKF